MVARLILRALKQKAIALDILMFLYSSVIKIDFSTRSRSVGGA
ncbi:hypothetical protein [Pleurocapsa sp. CCALA 161]|nr:hypothetical protein [Pleurocapsa sp. CCALA 161]